MAQAPNRSSTSLFAALGSVVSLGAQALLAVFLLKLFDASAVGQFSVVSQIAFCWATLALAQSPLSLLADRHTAAHAAAAAAWRQSAVRLLWMSPWAALALWWAHSHSASAAHWGALAPWAFGIAFLQMGWLLAQSLTLRQSSAASVAWVRLLPPVLAALLAWLGAVVLGMADSSTLLLSALLGYGAGAAWLLPVFRAPDTQASQADRQQPPAADSRSTRLKMLHTLTDVVVSGLLAVQWQALYGAAEAGMLLVLLRVFGFIPGLVHSAWAQVAMGQGQAQRRASLRMAALACAVILGIALAIEAALHLGGLQASWQGLTAYLWPLACWQMAASAMAAHAHRPFTDGRAARLSRQCIAMNAVMLALLLAPLLAHGLPTGLSAQQHLWLLSGFMTLALLGQALDHGLHRPSRSA